MTERRFLVIGAGSIGTRHARNLVELGQRDVIAYDPSADQRQTIERELGIETVAELSEGWARAPQVAIITSPTSLHVSLALEAAAHNCHYFVEKPLSDSLDGTDELIRLTEERELTSLVGCNMRFHPGIRALKELVETNALGTILSARVEFGQYLPDWRPTADYRVSYSARSELGGGIVLDAIHELDYATWLLGEVREVACFADHLSTLEIDTEDFASILLRFASGGIAEVHLDYVQRAYSRSCRLVGELGSALWDYARPELEVYRAADQAWTTTTLFDTWDPNVMYLDELRHFLRCLDGEEAPLADVRAGSYSLSIALAAKEAASEKRVVSVAKRR